MGLKVIVVPYFFLTKNVKFEIHIKHATDPAGKSCPVDVVSVAIVEFAI